MKPMRIIHVSAFPISLKSPNHHAVSRKISNGFVRNGHNVFDLSDRDMARAGGFGHRRFGIKAANRALLGLCRLHVPDLLLLGHADVILPETIKEIRRHLPDLRVVQWNVDPLFESDNVRRIESKLDVVDATLISTAGEVLRPFMRAGKSVGFLPNPVDFSIESGRNHEFDDLPFDLFYPCGNPARPLRLVFGRHWNMNEFIEALTANCPDIRMSLPGMFGRPKLFGHDYQTALEQAGAGLNISRRPDYFLYSSDRLAQLAGNGLAVCMERGSGYETLFSDEQIIFVSSIEELATRLNELKRLPKRRREVAAAGRARYHDLFNEAVIARYIEEVAFERLSEGKYEWPTLLPSSAG